MARIRFEYYRVEVDRVGQYEYERYDTRKEAKIAYQYKTICEGIEDASVRVYGVLGGITTDITDNI